MYVALLPRWSRAVLGAVVLAATSAWTPAIAQEDIADSLEGLRGLDAPFTPPVEARPLRALLESVAAAADVELELVLDEAVAEQAVILSPSLATVRGALEELRDDHGLWFFVDGPSRLTALRAYRAGSLDTAPRITSTVEPEYPEELQGTAVDGEVWLSGLVLADGSVGYLRILRAPHDTLAERAVDAVQQWRFDPATLDGEPIHTIALFTVSFRAGP